MDKQKTANKATSCETAKYAENFRYGKNTGEILVTTAHPIFDGDKLREEERLDVYYL